MVHYIVSNALQNNLPAINQLANINSLYICTLPEIIVNEGVIDFKLLAPYSNPMNMQVGLNNLGFVTTDYYDIGGGYLRLEIRGYLS